MMAQHLFILEKIRKFCVYQERSIFDVKMKLQGWKIDESIVSEIILQLKKDNFIDEERFAIAYATGKLRNNRWGRNKICYALQKKQVPDLTIQIALNSIDDDEYIKILKAVLSSKIIKEENEFKHNQKLVKYAMQKGFQAELIWKIIKDKH